MDTGVVRFQTERIPSLVIGEGEEEIGQAELGDGCGRDRGWGVAEQRLHRGTGHERQYDEHRDKDEERDALLNARSQAGGRD
jgi:hypothetical protein